MTLELIRTWWPIMATVLNVLFLLACFALMKTFARKEELQNIKEAHSELAQRHIALQQQVEKLPDHDEVSGLKLSIEKLRGDIREIRPKLEGLDRISNLLLENELKEKNG
ncbi:MULTISPECIES: DUF2730 family protein [Grimontia]|uniref:DUF2730 family protein n=1 Tax=Grimontia TaxID=246861 RepID=UPI0013031F1D|nr:MULTISPECIES: DUF2730 family protein [Grimontia]MDF2186162.1 DUF2730 family protein [Grimontia hollisae]WRV98558.1 DUF2730 family protein [Grimontia sp. NTOU-MAR1]